MAHGKEFNRIDEIEELFRSPEPEIFLLSDEEFGLDDSLLAMYDTTNPDIALLDLVDGEITALAGSPVTIYKYMGYASVDPLYEEERSKGFYRPAIKVMAHFDPLPIEENLSEFGMELTSELVFTFNKTYLDRMLGGSLKPGDVIKPDFVNMFYKIYEVQEDSFESYGIYHLRAQAKVWRAEGDKLLKKQTIERKDFETPASVIEELNQVIEYSDGYRAFFDVRYPRVPSKDLMDLSGLPLLFFAHGGGGGRYATASKARAYADKENMVAVTFDVRGQGQSLDELNNKESYGRRGVFHMRELMDMYELTHTLLKKYGSPTSPAKTGIGPLRINKNIIGWAGYSQGGAWSLVAACMSEQPVPAYVARKTGWKNPMTGNKYIGTDEEPPFPKVAVACIGGINPNLHMLAVGQGYTFPQTFVKSHYHTNTPDWSLYPGGAGYPPYDPTNSDVRVIWTQPTEWRQFTNVATSGISWPLPVGIPYTQAMLNMGGMWKYFNGDLHRDVGTFEKSQSPFFVSHEFLYDRLIKTKTYLLYQFSTEDLFSTANPLLDLIRRRCQAHPSAAGRPEVLAPGHMFTRIGLPGHGTGKVPAESGKYGVSERVFLNYWLTGKTTFPWWFGVGDSTRTGHNLIKNSFIMRVKPNIMFKADVPGLENKPFGYLNNSDGKDWKYVVMSPLSVVEDTTLAKAPDGWGVKEEAAADGKGAMNIYDIDFKSDGTIRPGQTTFQYWYLTEGDRLKKFIPSPYSQDYSIEHSLKTGFDLSSYISLTREPELPDLIKSGGQRMTQNVGPKQLIASGFLGYTENVNYREYFSPERAENDGTVLICGTVKTVIHAKANKPFMLGVSLWDVYTNNAGELREIPICEGYCYQTHPTKCNTLQAYIINLSAEAFPWMWRHKLKVVIETYPALYFGHETTQRSEFGVFRPMMYFHDFTADIEEFADLGGGLQLADFGFIDERASVSSVDFSNNEITGDSGVYVTKEIGGQDVLLSNMYIRLPLLPANRAVAMPFDPEPPGSENMVFDDEFWGSTIP